MTALDEPRAAQAAATVEVRRARIGPNADAVALVVLVLLTAVVAANRLAFDAWLTRFDLLTFFLPWYTLLGDRLRDLDLPGWNPHLFSGAPLAGDPESGWMYLPAMLAFAAIPATTAAFKALVAIHLAVAALSTYLFGRALGMGAAASLVAATVYLLGPFLHWTTNCCLVFAQFATWIPLALLGVELGVRARGWPERLAAWFLGGFAVSQMLAGWIGEGWLYAVLLPTAYAGYRVLLPDAAGASFADRLRAGVATAGGTVGLGFALGAAGVLPRLVVNAESNLAGGDYSRLGEAAVLNPPWTLAYLLNQTLGAGSGYHFRAASFGGVAVVLALLAVPLAGRRFAAPFFALLTLVAMTLTLEPTPLHQIFYLIPRYRELNEHDAWRAISLAAIGPAMLSGAAIERLPRWRGRRRLLPVVLLPLAAMAALTMLVFRPETHLGWTPLAAAAATTLLLAVAVATPRPPPAAPRRDAVGRTVPALILATAVLLPTGLELSGSWLGWPRHPIFEPQWRPDPRLATALETEVSRTDPDGAGAFLRRRLAAEGPFRYAGYGGFGFPGDEARAGSYMGRRLEPAVQAILVNGRPIFLGLSDIQGYNPLQVARYVEFMTALNGEPQDYHTAFLLPSGAGSPLLDLLALRYLLVDAALPPDRADVVALTAGHREVFRTPQVIVYERLPAPRHAWIVHDVRAVARGEALPLLAGGAVDPYRTALVEGTPPETGQPAAAAAESAEIVVYEPERIRIAARAAAPGLLVVSEVFEEGWRAFVDGREVEILPTNHALRGVPLPAGEHVVELRYDPWSLRLGLAITSVALAAMLAVFVAVGRRRIGGREAATAP